MVASEIDDYLRENLLEHYKTDGEIFDSLSKFVLRRDKKITSLFLRRLLNSKKKIMIGNVNITEEFQRRRKIFGKHNFDTCVRGRNTNRILIKYKEKSVITTYCQLNFFKWAHEIKLFEWIELNFDSLQTQFV